MRIRIAERCRPFSHVAGTHVVLPYSPFGLQIFPSRLILTDESTLESIPKGELHWKVQGPVRDWTIQQDLEAGCVRVYGFARNGFFRYWIFPPENRGLPRLWIEKTQIDPFLMQKEGFALLSERPVEKKEMAIPRLSFGIHKKLDWELVLRRNHLQEILPLWYRLGKMLPPTEEIPHRGVGEAWHQVKEAIRENRKGDLLHHWNSVWQAAFRSLLFPVRFDDLYQGIASEETLGASPLGLLREGAEGIERCFWTQEGSRQIHWLPCVPHDFVCGRWTGIQLPGCGIADLEWRKGLMRRMLFRPSQEGEVQFTFPKVIEKFRLRSSEEDKGVWHRAGEPFSTSRDTLFLLDRFQS